MFTLALFTVAKIWKQLKSPLSDEWIKDLVAIYNETFSALKKNEIKSFAATWMYLEIITLSEINQTEKDKYHKVLCICGI